MVYNSCLSLPFLHHYYGTRAGIELCVCRDSCNSSRSRCNGCNKTREGAVLALIMIGRSSFFFCYLGPGNLVRAAVETIGFRCVYIYNFLDSVSALRLSNF
ncbi:hypothetical protein YC2023_036631 [Brassica napus]